MLRERSDNVLLLYINSASVIVGRHQTIAAEVDEQFCAEHNIPVVRRISGGGAVYHDEGNVNYAFIVNTDCVCALDRDFAAPVVAALRAMGLNAEAGSRKEIRCGGYKISGSAAHVSRGRMLFHGTLLYSANLQRLEQTLKGNPALRGKGIPSVPDRVANIASLMASGETTGQFLTRIAELLRREL